MLEGLSGATRLFPVVGDPIAQVKSPAGMSEAFAARGVDAICVPAHVAPADWATFIAAIRVMRNVDGLIVTVPHKFAAFASCDAVTPRARFLGSVNMIRRLADGRLIGDMSDGAGFVAACRANGCDFAGRTALLVGAGGAGTAIAEAVSEAGVAQLALCDTDEARRDALIERLVAAGFPVVAAGNDATGFDIVLNATPLGMREGDPLPVKPGSLRAGQFAGDVVTKPEVPPFIAEARRLGLRTSTGGAMFAEVRKLMLDFLLDTGDAGARAA